METIFYYYYAYSSYGFKSYYVVWKLADARAKKKEDDGLNRTM